MRRIVRWVGIVCLWLALATVSPVAAGLSISVGGRALAPGEPLRVWVHSDIDLASLTGRFLERPISFHPLSSSSDSTLWAGWTLVDLDAKTGPTVVELRGQSADGKEILGTHAVTVIPRNFPEERLTVEPRYVEPPAVVRKRLDRERAKLRELYLQRDAPVVKGPFKRPVPGEATSIFGMRRVFNNVPRSPHSGLDLRAGSGTPVLASGKARVVLAEDLYYSGNTVILDHGGGLFTLYAHLSKILVVETETVNVGQQVGLSGATGRVTGPHLHWGAKIGDIPFDPTALLDASLFGPP